MAHAAWDLHKASSGRFRLGLGTQVKAHNERRYGIAWSAQAPRMRDYIGALRAIWHAWETETPLDYHSENHTLTPMTPNFSPRPTGLPTIPISVSASPQFRAFPLRTSPDLCEVRNLSGEVSTTAIASVTHSQNVAARARCREMRGTGRQSLRLRG